MIENKTDSFEIDDNSLCMLSSGLNSEQLFAVKETRNVVVSAGAGSGKTTVLASRYAYLVEAKNVPSEKILTLTFTKKAANEMKERIFNGLKAHLHGKDIKGKKELGENFPHLAQIKKRAQNAIENFDKTHIQTLDSYFSEIAKKGAHFYGINPNFTLDDEKITSKIQYSATKYVLEHLEESEIKEIAQIFQIQNVAEELFASSVLKFSTVINPIDFQKSLENQKKCLIQDFKNITERLYEKIESYIVLERNPKASATLQNLYDFIDENGNPSAPVLGEEVFKNREAALEFLEKQFLPYCKTLSDFFGGDFSRVADQNYKKLKAEALLSIEKLYAVANSVSSFKLQEKVFAHLERFQSEMIRTKRVSGLLTFSDVSDLALSILREHSEIRSVEKEKFDAIMIDEFQDDNSLQCDVLLILCDQKEKFDENGVYQNPKLSDSDLLERLDSHKLFFVGDDKQSIYRFRGADVSVFRNLSSSIKNSIELKTNYRSNAELIRSFNTIFGGYDYPNGEKVQDENSAIFMTKDKFPARTDGMERIPDFEADYKRVEVPSFRISENSFSEKKVIVALYPKNSEEETEDSFLISSEQNDNGEDNSEELERKVYECEASFVAREIKKLREEKDENGKEKYKFKDIALLFRSSSPTAAYENELLQAGIPYSTEVYKGFFSDGPINDIVSLLKLCVYPQDKNAYAKVLRSPFCSLSFQELQKVLENTENPYKMPFSEQMLSSISDDETLSEKIQNLKAIYDEINSRLKTEKFTKTISYIWYELGYRYETLWNKTVSMYSSFYDILFEMARLAEGKTQSLSSFIDMIKTYEDSDKKLDGLDVVMNTEDAVQILTIHKSKGLEFKVVFVCAISASPRPPKSQIEFSAGCGFLLNTPVWRDFQKACGKLSKDFQKSLRNSYFFSVVAEKNEREESAELRRLAYVAFTRAEEKLYLVGNENDEFKEADSSIEKCRKFEVHSPDEKSFSYQKISGKKQELKEFESPYTEPKSIYQLLLPILFEGACDDGNGGCTVKNPAFDFVNDSDSFKSSKNEEKETLLKSDYIKNLPSEENVKIITEELSPKTHISPSHLEGRTEESEIRSASFPCAPVNPEYELINKIVASSVPCGADEVPVLEDEDAEILAAPDFTFADFGTIAHAYMEGKVLGEEPKIPLRTWNGMNERFIPGVQMEKWGEDSKAANRDKKIAKIRELCKDMAAKFENSAVYKEASKSEWKKTEYSFRSVVEKSSVVSPFSALPGISEGNEEYADELIVNGQIDLVYKNSGDSPYKYTIVDYKTNQKIEPEIYYAQLSCYRKAISQMLACAESEIRCVLYYLRFAKEVEIPCQ